LYKSIKVSSIHWLIIWSTLDFMLICLLEIIFDVN
jgi:hypothetical protein